MFVDGNATTVVAHLHAAIFTDPDLNVGTISGKCLVDGVVDNLVYQVMEAADARGANVHARALANRLKTLQNLNIFSIVMRWFVICHALLLCTTILDGATLR